ncbi:hypothetical protein ACQ5SO_20590 [Rhodovulum sp. DZ06]|uniref:hypothetical protein n=1 Tax=Rhodovulum sp. DZ06 TaxID=3425126 RepID=UPI003D33C33A
MTREDLTIALALALGAAVLFGVLLHLLWQRLRHGGAAELEKHEHMAERLHEAEEAQEAAEIHMRAEIARVEAERAEAEAALHRALAEREAELAAAMDTVGSLRRDLEGWQEAYEAIARGRS